MYCLIIDKNKIVAIHTDMYYLWDLAFALNVDQIDWAEVTKITSVTLSDYTHEQLVSLYEGLVQQNNVIPVGTDRLGVLNGLRSAVNRAKCVIPRLTYGPRKTSPTLPKNSHIKIECEFNIKDFEKVVKLNIPKKEEIKVKKSVDSEEILNYIKTYTQQHKVPQKSIDVLIYKTKMQKEVLANFDVKVADYLDLINKAGI